MLKGDLSLFNIGEILQSLSLNAHTGTLQISTGKKGEKCVCFQKGDIVFYSDGPPQGRVPQIGEILLRKQAITAAQLEEALAEQRATKNLVGEILIQKGFVTEQGIRKALELQTLEGLYELFLLKQGTFEFQMNFLPDALTDGILKRLPIALNTNSVIMEGLRQVDEWVAIHRTVRTFDEIFKRIDVLTTPPMDSSGLLLEMVNGIQPARDLFKSYPGSRFECSKKLCEFVEKGLIRALTVEECLQLAKERVDLKQHAQATAFLTFAAQLSPSDAGIRVLLGDTFTAAFEETAAKDAYLEAVRLYYEAEDFSNVAALGERLLPKVTLDAADLEKLFFSFVRLQNFKRAASTGNQLVAIQQKLGQFEQAAVIMEAIAAMAPEDLNLKIQAATLFEKAGNLTLATKELEEVSATLEKQKKYRELVKTLRLLSQWCPDRMDLKQKITAVQALQELLDRKRKYRMTIAGISAIVALILTVIPVLYEIKAREFFSHAERLEQAALLSMNFARAKEAYLEVVKNYCFSTKVAEAQSALERISDAERTYLTRIDLEDTVRREEHESKIFAMREELVSKLREADAAEKAGDVQTANSIYKKLTVDYAEIPATKNFLFPLRITSEPSGGTVTVDGAEVGKTPIIYRFKPGTTVNITVARSSCVIAHQTIRLLDQWDLHFHLDRRPAGEMSLVPVIQQPMLVAPRRLVIASRDGNLYALDPVQRNVAWQRVVGRFGDRISNLEMRGGQIYLGTVTGEATSISVANGKSRWIAKLGASILARPAVSEDGRWVAFATTAGTVHVIANENGTEASRFSTENEVLAQPLFVGTSLIVGSTDNYVYSYSLQSQSVEAQKDITSDVVSDLARDGEAVLIVTRDGILHRLRSSSLEVIWSRPLGSAVSAAPIALPGGILIGTSSGQVFLLDRATGKSVWEAPLGKGAVAGVALTQKRIYACLESGKLVVLELDKGTVAWGFQSDMALSAPPVLIDGMVFLGGATGKIQYLEVIE